MNIGWIFIVKIRHTVPPSSIKLFNLFVVVSSPGEDEGPAYLPRQRARKFPTADQLLTGSCNRKVIARYCPQLLMVDLPVRDVISDSRLVPPLSTVRRSTSLIELDHAPLNARNST